MAFRARLRDDDRCLNGNDVWGGQVRLDDDWACKFGTTVGDAPTPDATTPSDQGQQYWQCAILQRDRVGFDDDGVPIFDWTQVTTAPAILRLDRKENNSVAGITTETGTVTLAYAGPTKIFETCVVRREDAVLYRVTAVKQPEQTVTLSVSRVDQQIDAPPSPGGSYLRDLKPGSTLEP